MYIPLLFILNLLKFNNKNNNIYIIKYNNI